MLSAILLALATAGTAWALAVWLIGGFTIRFGSFVIASTDPFRPLALGIVTGLIYMLVRGPVKLRRDLSGVRRFSALLAIVLAACPAVAGLARNSWTAAGADSYAYVSQTDLWLRGDLRLQVPLAGEVPWPNALWSFTPHGFRPAQSGTALVPVTAAGLPLMMAAAKTIAGHCAMFWVVPLAGALFVWTTFAIGRRIDSDLVGLAAAWLIATSPAVLAMLVSPMSDVPAAAFWAVAVYFALGHSRRSAAAAGLAASAAILIRPNLAPLAAVIAGWILLTNARRWNVAALVAGVLPGCLIVAWLNGRLYGSPLASGYGPLPNLFALSYIATNLRLYLGWLLESQTAVVLIGFLALVFPMRRIWKTTESRQAAVLLVAITATVWALYLIYTPFDAWWYLRFLLPAWPAMCIAVAVVLVRVIERPNIIIRTAAIVTLVGVGIHGLLFAAHHGAFPTGEGDRRYATIAKFAEQVTEPSSVILTGQHTGPTRYYAGRITLRFDLLDDAWLDRAVEWLSAHGHHPYFLLDEWEIPIFQQRFSQRNTLGALSLTPVLAYQSRGVPGQVYLFDPMRPDGPTRRPVAPPPSRFTCVEPAHQ